MPASGTVIALEQVVPLPRVTIALALALVAPVSIADAQSEAQVWSSASVEADASDRVEIGLEQHLRFDDDSSRFGALLTDLGATYKAADWIRIAAGYRFGYQRDGGGDLVIRHRLHLQSDLRYEPADRLRLSLRTRFQENFRDTGNRHKLRNRGQVSFKATRKLTGEASVELFHRLDGNDGVVFETLRLTIGAGYELSKRLEVGAFYRYEQPQEDPADPDLHILGIELGYAF